MSDEEKQICLDAIAKWNTDKQLDMVVEECAELIKAIVKFKRYDKDDRWREKIVEEAADVSIMLKQLILIVSSEEEFKNTKIYKLNSLKAIIENDDPERGLKK